ncbi:Mitochondrial substrate carrier family protein ucpB [Diplonema papillatum]|nr:Mitochondrial substrate carrier family protein ucpB [Diplonema papillatum]KAJ9443274.1 Mitochondrial substrate carrier family protein ucpB [Diplonema papillatum]|eukprot:gene2155-3307_t
MAAVAPTAPVVSNKPRAKTVSSGVEFLISGASAMLAITFTNPMDVVKTRLQLQGQGGKPKVYNGVSGALSRIWKEEGLRGLNRGLSAAYLLQFTNVGTRFGGYDLVKKLLGIEPGSRPSYPTLLACGGMSGAMAGLVSNPFYLMKTRLQAHGSTLSLTQAVNGIRADGGLLGYWRGCFAFIPRVAAASSVQLATYDVVKHEVMRVGHFTDGFAAHFVSSWITSVAVVLAMQPFDFSATRIMSSATSSNNVFTVLKTTVRQEGVRAVYQGTLANYLRFGPYCILVFVFAEQLRTLARS